MSDLPIALHAERIRAVVVGGGAVATRKAFSLLSAGAQVTVVAPRVSDDLQHAASSENLQVIPEPYDAAFIAKANLVIAATDSRDVNSRVAVDANRLGLLVNIADYPEEGNFHTMALHRSGDVTIAVSAGGVPGAAARIRDAIAQRFDGRYERAVNALRGLRSRMIHGDEHAWRAAAPALLGDDFCESVENGSFDAKVKAWG